MPLALPCEAGVHQIEKAANAAHDLETDAFCTLSVSLLLVVTSNARLISGSPVAGLVQWYHHCQRRRGRRLRVTLCD